MAEDIIMDLMPTLQQKLVHALDVRGWSDKELADRVGVSTSKLRRWRIGEGEPSLSEAVRLADLLDVDLDYLARDDRHAPRSADGLTDWQRKVLGYAEDLERLRPGEVLARLMQVEQVSHGRDRRPPA